MARLSIIIPLQGNADLLESGLVTVLENRPPDSEVLVVLNGRYDDPYRLEDEVRFVRVADGASWVESVNAGAAQSRGEILHLLQCGVQATDGWCQHALEQFEDDDVAAVAPLVVHPYKPSRVQAACVDYGAGGRRIVRRGTVRRWAAQPCWPVLGPTCLAGFYRKSCWDALGGMAPQVGDELADVDFALRLAALRWRAFLDSRVIVRALRVPQGPRGFLRGQHAQRLFLRNIPRAGWAASLLQHPFSVVRQNMTSLAGILALPAELAGRLSVWRELAAVRHHHRHLAHLRHEARRPRDVRLDPAHSAELQTESRTVPSQTRNAYWAETA